MLVHWYVGTLVRWYVGMLVHWYIGTLVLFPTLVAEIWYVMMGCWYELLKNEFALVSMKIKIRLLNNYRFNIIVILNI